MANLDDNNPITANGNYDKVFSTRAPLIGVRFSGMNGGGDTVQVQERVNQTYETIATFTADGGEEIQMTGNRLRVVVSSYSQPISFNLVAIPH